MSNLEKNIAINYISDSSINEKIEKMIRKSKKHNEEMKIFADNSEQLIKNIDEKVVLLEAASSIEEMRKFIKNIVENAKNMTFTATESALIVSALTSHKNIQNI